MKAKIFVTLKKGFWTRRARQYKKALNSLSFKDIEDVALVNILRLRLKRDERQLRRMSKDVREAAGNYCYRRL